MPLSAPTTEFTDMFVWSQFSYIYTNTQQQQFNIIKQETTTTTTFIDKTER